MNITDDALTSLGHPLDLTASAFGELRRSTDLLCNPTQLRERMAADGYLFMPGLLDRQQVLDAQKFVTDRMAQSDNRQTSHELAENNPPLAKILYTGKMLELYETFLGAPVRHFDFTWFRAVPPGGSGTYPHADIVYMGRGTFNLFTSWTPICDVPRKVGGLMILENSHRHADKIRNYLERDVDTYCTNSPDAGLIESGAKQWQDWDGRLSSDPVSLREKLGGRWLTTDFKVGDVLCFGMATIHASLDNQSNQYRLSSDSRYQLASDPVDERWIGTHPVGHGVAGKKGKIC